MAAKRVSFLLSFLILGFLCAPAAQADLVGWWKLDGNVLDSSGKGHNGVIYGSPTWVPGISGQALQFATTDRVEMPGTSPADGFPATSGEVTWAVWFKVPADATAKTIICLGPTGGAHTSGNRSINVETSGKIMIRANGVGTLTSFSSAVKVNDDQWHHVAATIAFDASGVNDVLKVYIDGDLSKGYTTDTCNTNANAANATAFILTLGKGPQTFVGSIDDVQVHNKVLSDAEVVSIMKGSLFDGAVNPSPSDGATDVSRDTMLNWSPGRYPGTYDIYLGTTFADVNTASRTNAKGLLVSQGQTGTTFDPTRFAFGTTYYWRVDEVNSSPDATRFKGQTWTFTTEPIAYPVDNATITATASSSVDGQGPQNTINGTGMTNDQHNNDLGSMWLSAAGVTGPAWIQYEFGELVKLHEMWVWNHNGLLEGMLGLGSKNVTIEYSTDGTTFKTLGTTYQFARATSQPDYTHNTTVAFGDVAAKYVKLTISSNWGGILPQYGLSEVRFFALPVMAREPSPKSGATDIAPAVTLSWRAGREAGSHQVFLGTDPNNLTVTATVPKSSYDADLNLGQTYYWKIAEVNQAQDPTIWTSDVWSLSTLPFLVVDDFESYTDQDGHAIWQTWIDGYGIATNGSQVGNANPPYAERTIIHGGKQAMPLFYSNTAGASYSEAERTFATAQDWTRYGCKTLALSFYGDPNNTGQMYLKINGTKIPYNGQAADLQRAQWQPWNINLAASGANLKSVTKLAIGVDGAGAAGVLRIDDIRLYPTAGTTITPVDPGKTGLVAWYKFDGDFKDSAGTYTATAAGDAKIVNDPVRGQVVSLDGTGDGVAVPLLGSGSTLTVAVWVNTAVDPIPLQYESIFAANGWEAKDLHWRYQYGKVNADLNGGPGAVTGLSVVKASQWNHVAVTISATEFAVWLNGIKEASRPLTAPAAVTLGEGMLGAWLGTDGVTISRTFTGKMDDARFYNRALSPQEIASLAGRTGPFAQPF